MMLQPKAPLAYERYFIFLRTGLPEPSYPDSGDASITWLLKSEIF